MKQDWINNTEDGREIYEILDANLPTIEAGGTVTEEQIWNCVNLLLERETKVKNLAQPDVSGSLPSEEYELERLYDWVTDEKREPAQTKFTSGKTRDIAREIEYRLKGNFG